MIYTKKANFPYPVLMNFTNEYKEPEFELDVNMRDNLEEFIIDCNWSISSQFIKNLLQEKKASLVLVIKSKDNQFHELAYKKRILVNIPRSKLSINARTVMQMMVRANVDISFENNNDLNEIYDELKGDIYVQAGNVLAFSNTVIFDGSQNKPYDIFEKKIDSKIKSDVEVRLGSETIIIVYKREDLQFAGCQNSRELNYPYLYLGLQKALINFIIHENPLNIEDIINLDEMEPPENALETKLLTLMRAKGISELSMDTLDEVIYRISDNLIMKYHDAVRGLQNAN